MRVLRVGNSSDQAGPLPDAQRAWHIAASAFAAATGEQVETVLKRAWPGPELPGIVERWMLEFDPDMVVLQVNNFWYAHESATLWLNRRLGRPGETLTRVGDRVSKSDWYSESRAAVALGRLLTRLFPSATHFTVPQVAAVLEDALRKVLTREGVVLLVRGHEQWTRLPGASARQNRRNTARNQQMKAAMRQVCERLRVPYFQRPPIDPDALRTVLNAARFHTSAEGERLLGEFDGQAMIAAWTRAGTTAIPPVPARF